MFQKFIPETNTVSKAEVTREVRRIIPGCGVLSSALEGDIPSTSPSLWPETRSPSAPSDPSGERGQRSMQEHDWSAQLMTLADLVKNSSPHLQQHGQTLRLSYWVTSARERQTSYDIAYMQKLKKMVQMNLQNRKRITDVKNWWLPGGRGGKGDG